MHRSISTALFVFALAAPVAAGEFSDAERRFRLTAPGGWVQEASPDKMIGLIIASPRNATTGGNCLVGVSANELGGRTQAEVDELAAGAVNNEAFWKSVMAGISLYKSSTIEKWGARDQDGRKVFFMKATSTAELNGVSITLTQLQDLHPVPGTTYSVTCSVFAPVFEAEAKDFDTIMASFRPSLGLTVSWMRGQVNPARVRGATGYATRNAAAIGALRTARRR
ncbi:MAG: hypothetical protein HOP13_04230 [Alphaproteobacteria bacterium]|nr:hypothetical protein [Alphaproteobacteria bacterium]